MTVKLLILHHLEFLSLKGGCTGSSESTLVKMPHCWKPHVTCSFEGVDDNGAGVAALLEVARQVTSANKQGAKRQNTIIFACFDGEELCKDYTLCTLSYSLKQIYKCGSLFTIPTIARPLGQHYSP